MRFSKGNCFEFFVIGKEETVFFVFVCDKVGCVALEKGSKVNDVGWRKMSVSCALLGLSLMIRTIRWLMTLMLMLVLRDMFNSGIYR